MDDNYGWEMDKNKPMSIVIKKDGKRLFSIFLGEAMESAGRHEVLKHVKECDNSPWLHRWHKEAMETAVEILKGETR